MIEIAVIGTCTIGAWIVAGEPGLAVLALCLSMFALFG